MSVKNDVIRITALYERLSRDDDQTGDSLSISNQKMYLEDYAIKNGFRNIRHYTDDGYTGRNFNRPGFQEMLKDIDNGLIGTVIVKDMSRFGRNYLQVGFYTEMMFPKKNVRFIAINNNVDSINPTENDFAPFLNIMNEWYAKDTSNKIKTIFLSRMKEGKRCSGSIPYGYNRVPGDKQHLVIDPVASEIVKRIFKMASEDIGPTEIARILTEDKVLIPTAYTRRYHPEQCNQRQVKDEYKWHPTTVASILKRKEYLGHTVLRKSIGTDFKTDARRATEEDEQLVFENTHEAIIDEETWDLVCNSRIRRPKKYKIGKYNDQNRYDGLLFCADCGSRMTLQVHYSEKEGTPIFTYRCGNYKKRWDIAKSCSIHHISMKDLDTVVGVAVKRVIWNALQDEEEFAKRLAIRWAEQDSSQLEKNRSELNKCEKRFNELGSLIQRLYQDYLNDLLPERQYRTLVKEYDDEQNRLEIKIEKLKTVIDNEEKKPADTERFLKIIRQYKNQDSSVVLSRSLLRDLIDRIEVHEATGGKSKNRLVEVDIFFRFIGDCSFEPTPEELMDEEIKKIEAEKAEIEKMRHKEFMKAEKRRKLLEERAENQIRKDCAICGKEFYTRRSRQIYCSKECGKVAAINRQHDKVREKNPTPWARYDGHPFAEKVCIVCGKHFWPSNGKNTICSKECRNKRQMDRYYQRVEERKQEANNLQVTSIIKEDNAIAV